MPCMHDKFNAGFTARRDKRQGRPQAVSGAFLVQPTKNVPLQEGQAWQPLRQTLSAKGCQLSRHVI
ncbi:hypothetical protein AWM70_10815 [Paenibacillus yonginensis]|uniref:Uncharacterized protein n=1 Tax=Paenibacillus yonginensis TaxID=1462996 RepID=A0A1B1N0S0_9BACL|nr:hypothetical protein AWM70_10815 [Paenibacillus yonginensis]